MSIKDFKWTERDWHQDANEGRELIKERKPSELSLLEEPEDDAVVLIDMRNRK